MLKELAIREMNDVTGSNNLCKAAARQASTQTAKVAKHPYVVMAAATATYLVCKYPPVIKNNNWGGTGKKSGGAGNRHQ